MATSKTLNKERMVELLERDRIHWGKEYRKGDIYREWETKRSLK